jgi:hypothetical protein
MIQRYEICCDPTSNSIFKDLYIATRPDGRFVEYEDHAAHVARLERRVKALTEALEMIASIDDPHPIRSMRSNPFTSSVEQAKGIARQAFKQSEAE